MPTPTTRRNLPQPIGSDPPSELRVAATALATAVDGDVPFQEATLVSLAPTLAGRLLYATDAGQVLVDIGSSLLTLQQPLQYVAGTTSRTVAANTFVEASDNVTITLPAPTANSVVVVQAGSTDIGASVSTGSAALIYGLGFATSGRTSVPLWGGGVASFLANGTSWLMAGQQDTGWVPLTYGTGWRVLSGSDPAAARLAGDQVTLRGTLQNNTGGTAAGPSSSIATLPAAMDPALPFNRAIYTAGNSLLSLSNSGGLLSIGLGSISNTDWIVLSGINYPVN